MLLGHFLCVLEFFLGEFRIFVSESPCKIIRAVFTGCELAECAALRAVTEFRQTFKRVFSAINCLKFSGLACEEQKVTSYIYFIVLKQLQSKSLPYKDEY